MRRLAGRRSGGGRVCALATAAAVVALLVPPLVSSAAVATTPVGGQPARVDPSFGGGFATHNLSALDDQAAAVAVAPDGSLVVVGKTNTEPFDHTPPDIFVARFTSAGRLDTSFGTNGVTVIGAAGQVDLAHAVAVQEGGRIVVGGAVNNRPSVLRLTTAGRLDPDFQGGIVAVPGPESWPLTALALQDDGKILFTGSVFGVGRLNTDGSRDSTFATNGVALAPRPSDPNSATVYDALAVQPDGRIVVGGSFNAPSMGGPAEVAALARYTADGAPDVTFGNDGFVQTHLDTDYANRGTRISDLVVQPDGRIVAVGDVYEWAMNGPPGMGPPSTPAIWHMGLSDVAVLRYLPDGRLDPAFSGDGVSIGVSASRTVPSQGDWPMGPIGVPETDTRGFDVALAPDGSILVTGSTFELQRLPVVLRYTSGGLPDPTFGPDGALVVDVGGRWGVPSAMAVQPDGRVVVVGATRTGLIERGIHWDLMVGRIIPGTGAGTVWTWGWNALGQLGDGAKTDQHEPEQVPGLTGVVAVSAGAYHTLALRGDGTVWAWGMNVVGQLGDGTDVERTKPVRVSGLSGVVAVSAGGLHSMALRGDGTLWAWGHNGFGQLGDGTTSMRLRPVRVPTLNGIATISAGLYHSLAIREDGRALGWGYNAAGQLGEGTRTDHHTPVWLPLMPSNYAVHTLSAGGLHSLAVGVNASFTATGWNGLTQINGSGGDMIGFMAPLPQIAHAASAGWYHSLVLHTNGSVRASGWNVVGQLGDGTSATHGWAPVPGLTGIRAVSAGGLHNLALTDDGRLKAWGWNVAGQLGTGTTADARSPVELSSLANVAAVSAGYLHSVVIRG